MRAQTPLLPASVPLQRAPPPLQRQRLQSLLLIVEVMQMKQQQLLHAASVLVGQCHYPPLR